MKDRIRNFSLGIAAAGEMSWCILQSYLLQQQLNYLNSLTGHGSAIEYYQNLQTGTVALAFICFALFTKTAVNFFAST